MVLVQGSIIEAAYKDTYGGLYNWYTVNTNKLCPIGWNVPTDPEWTTLTDYLTNDGYGYQGSGSDIAKSMAATFDWAADPTAGNTGNDQASNNSSGFTALPGGNRRYDGVFGVIGSIGYWWSASEIDATMAYLRSIHYNLSFLFRDNFEKRCGFSIRCIKD